MSRVKLSVEGGRVDVWVEHTRLTRFACPECDQVLPVYDHTEEQVWRDLESCAILTYLHARELYLHIEAHTLSCVVKRPQGTGARVRSFAAAVNTAASRAAIEEPQRPQRIREAEQRLATAQASRGPIEAAQHRAQEITSNPQLLAGIESARRELESHRKSKSPQPAVPGSTALGKDTPSS